MGYKLKTAPTVEPVTLAEAKLHLKLDSDTTDDTLITALIVAARQAAENYTGRAFINQTWEYATDEFPDEEMTLRPAPLSSITSITYVDANGATQTLSTSVYDANTYDAPGCAFLRYGQCWPSARDVENSILITFVAGYGSSASSVPAPVKAAILLTVGHLYEHRESVIIGTTAAEMPQSASWLLDPYRIIEF